MQTPLHYRQARQQDMEWAWQLFRAGMGPYIERTWGWDELFQHHAFLEKLPVWCFTVVLQRDQPIGGYGLMRRAGHLHLETLLIDAPWQGRGLGSIVVRELQRYACQRQKPLKLRVLKCSPAMRFYRRLGFVVSDEDPQRYYLRWPEQDTCLGNR